MGVWVISSTILLKFFIFLKHPFIIYASHNVVVSHKEDERKYCQFPEGNMKSEKSLTVFIW